MDIMKQMLNAHALKSVIKPIDYPDESLCVGTDERLSDIPILIFTEQHLAPVMPEIEKPKNRSYEDVQLDGTGGSLSLEDFPTDNFYIGNPY